MENLSRWAFLSRPSLQVFKILWISLERHDQSKPCEKKISSNVFRHSFAARGKQKGRKYSAFSAVLSAERPLSEVACHKRAFGCWRFRTVFDPLADHSVLSFALDCL